MLNQVEDINDSMNRQIKKENGNINSKAINIAFFDISQMSGPMQAVYMIAAYAAIGAAMYFFYSKMIKGPEEVAAAELLVKQAKDAKKAKRANKKG